MIPEQSDFPLVKLSEIAEIQIGKTPSRDNPKLWGEGFTWVSISDLNNSRFVSDSKEQITDLGVSKSNIKLTKAGTLLFSYKLSIGKVAITGKDLYTNEAIASLIIKDNVALLPEYFYYTMRDLDYSATSDSAAKGKTLNKAKLKELQIPLPPLPVQQKIAAILDAADLHRQKTKTLIEKYDQLTQSIFLEMFGDPVKNEKGWEIGRLPEMVKSERHSIKRGPFGGALKKEIFVESGFLVYEQQHAIYSDFSRGRYFIDRSKYEELSGFKVKPGDLIISCSGTIGKIAEIPVGAQEGIINQALLKLSLNSEKINNQFFIFHFSHKRFQDVLFGVSRGTGITNFPPMGVIKDIPFIVPPIKLQNEFANHIKIASSQKQLALTALAKSEDLFNTLLKRAFKGELVN
jgi:type I restriction enzyme, S subunit